MSAPSASLRSLFDRATNGCHTPRQVTYGPFLSISFVDSIDDFVRLHITSTSVLQSAVVPFFTSVQPTTGNFLIYPHPPPLLNALTRDANHTVKLTSHACGKHPTTHTQRQNITSSVTNSPLVYIQFSPLAH